VNSKHNIANEGLEASNTPKSGNTSSINPSQQNRFAAFDDCLVDNFTSPKQLSHQKSIDDPSLTQKHANVVDLVAYFTEQDRILEQELNSSKDKDLEINQC
jgi:hypothetical protein